MYSLADLSMAINEVYATGDREGTWFQVDMRPLAMVAELRQNLAGINDPNDPAIPGIVQAAELKYGSTASISELEERFPRALEWLANRDAGVTEYHQRIADAPIITIARDAQGVETRTSTPAPPIASSIATFVKPPKIIADSWGAPSTGYVPVNGTPAVLIAGPIAGARSWWSTARPGVKIMVIAAGLVLVFVLFSAAVPPRMRK